MLSLLFLLAAVSTGCPEKGYITLHGFKASRVSDASIKFDSLEEYQNDVEEIGDACYHACITSKSACEYFQFSNTGSCLGFKGDGAELAIRTDRDEFTSVGVPCSRWT